MLMHINYLFRFEVWGVWCDLLLRTSDLLLLPARKEFFLFPSWSTVLVTNEEFTPKIFKMLDPTAVIFISIHEGWICCVGCEREKMWLYSHLTSDPKFSSDARWTPAESALRFVPLTKFLVVLCRVVTISTKFLWELYNIYHTFLAHLAKPGPRERTFSVLY